MGIEQKLRKIEGMFNKKKQKYWSYSFSIGMFENGYWNFRVVDSWHKWIDRDLETSFTGKTLESALDSFIAYVKENGISIKRLQCKIKKEGNENE